MRGLQPRVRTALIADGFAEAAAAAASSMRLGRGLDPETQLGPLISRDHRDSVEAYIKVGVDEGAQLSAAASARRRSGGGGIPHAGGVHGRG